MTRWSPFSRISRPTISPPASARRCALRAYVFAHKDNPQARKETEAALLKFVQGSPAPGGLMAACRALRLIGGPDSVPVLAALVLKPETTDPARYALERIPGSEADQALLAALDKAQGDIRRGIVFSLGERRVGRRGPGPGATGRRQGRRAGRGRRQGAGQDRRRRGRQGPDGRAVEARSHQVRSRIGALARGRRSSWPRETRPRRRPSMTRSSRPTPPRPRARPLSRERSPPGPIRRADAEGPHPQGPGGKGRIALCAGPGLVPDNFGAGEIGKVADLVDKLPEAARIQLTASWRSIRPKRRGPTF